MDSIHLRAFFLNITATANVRFLSTECSAFIDIACPNTDGHALMGRATALMLFIETFNVDITVRDPVIRLRRERYTRQRNRHQTMVLLQAQLLTLWLMS